MLLTLADSASDFYFDVVAQIQTAGTRAESPSSATRGIALHHFPGRARISRWSARMSSRVNCSLPQAIT